MNCVFCETKNLNGEIFYETQNFFCVYNLRPVLPGHSMIIPKRHIVMDMSEDEIEELPSVVKLALVVLKKAYKGNGFNIVIQEGAAAGASINHFHMHVVPRRKGDIKNDEWAMYFKKNELTRPKLSKQQMAKEVEKIKKTIDSL